MYDAAVGVALEPIRVAVARRPEQALRGRAVRLEVHKIGAFISSQSAIHSDGTEMALDLAGVAVGAQPSRRVEIIAGPLIAEPRRSVAGAPITVLVSGS